MQQLKEQYPGKALITGASSGIGEQFAIALARAGKDLVLTARREQALLALSQQLQQQYGVEVTVKALDLADADAVAQMIEELQPQDIDMLISNAGFGVLKGAFTKTALAEMQRMWQVNSLSAAALAHGFARSFKQRSKPAAMLFTGSIEGEAAFPYSSAYAASKAFLHSLVYGLAVELRGDSIEVLLLAPGATDTQAPISQGISRDQLAGLMSPQTVVKQALKQLLRGGRVRFIPGWHNRLFIGLLRLLPVRIASRLSGWGMREAMRKSAAA